MPGEGESENTGSGDNHTDTTPPTNTADEERKIFGVSVKLPQFWQQQPEIYFEQAEASFRNAGVTRSRTKYDYLLVALPVDVAIDVQDVMVKCRTDSDPYETMKEQLIKRNTASNTHRVEQLLSNATMGDRTPSNFYRWMLRTAGSDASVSEKFIRQLWIRQLPTQVEASLRPFFDRDADIITAIADEIHEIYRRGPGVNAVEKSTKNDDVSQLKAEIAELKKMVSQLSVGKPRNRSRSRDRLSVQTNKEPEAKLCHFHYKFGDDAYKCRGPPCPKAPKN